MGIDILNIIYITKWCNFDCKYCYEGAHKKHEHMSKEECEEILHNIFKDRPKDRTASIMFFGGEPLLNFDVLLHGLEICKQYYDQGYRVNAMFTTNGSLLNEDRVKKLFRYRKFLFIHFSFDGREETQNKNRVFSNSHIGTHFIVEKNAKTLLKYFPLATVRVVVEDPKTHLEDIKYLSSLGFRQFCVQALRKTNELNSDEYISDFYKYINDVNEYLNSLKNGSRISEINHPYTVESAKRAIEEAAKREDEYHYYVIGKQKYEQKTASEKSFYHF